MGIIAPTYDERVKYTLSHDEYGSLVITEPVGWREDEKEYARNKNYHGVFAKFSNSLKFVGNGAEYIQSVYAIYGINAEIRLVRDEQHPHTDMWERSYEGYLDLSTYELEKGQLSVKFNAGGLEQLLKTRESDDVEIERDKTIDGGSVSALSVKEVHIDGRRIFLQSLLETPKYGHSVGTLQAFNSIGGSQIIQSWSAIRLSTTYQSDERVFQQLSTQNYFTEIYNTNNIGGAPENVFYQSERQATKELNIKIDFVVGNVYGDFYDQNYKFVQVWLLMFKVEDNGDFTFLFDKSEKLTYFGAVNGLHNQWQGTKTINFEPDMAACLAYAPYSIRTSSGAGIIPELNIEIQQEKNQIEITEDSYFPDSDSKIILAHELGDRLLHILTNKQNAFFSHALGRTDLGYLEDGEQSLTGFAHGMWIRQFDKEPQNDDNRYKAFATSFKDYMQSLTAIWNLGMGIEKIGYSERVRVEPLTYFYNRNTTIKLPNQVKKVKRSIAKEFYCSALELGYEKGGQYEEAMGLDAYNGRSKFNTVINSIKKTFIAVSKYRTDPYGLELPRRKPIKNHPTEDTSYDQDVFALDLKRWIGNSKFKLRKWQDDFAQQPTGVFSPDTAFNLRFSPVNMLIRHGWVISAGLVKYATDYVRYGSSTANSNLKTRLQGENEHAENGDIINSELDTPRFVPEWIEFEHQLDFELNQKLEGKTIVEGKEIPNFYGRIQFLNENNEWEKGYLFSVKPNDGKWKLLKAYK